MQTNLKKSLLEPDLIVLVLIYHHIYKIMPLTFLHRSNIQIRGEVVVPLMAHAHLIKDTIFFIIFLHVFGPEVDPLANFGAHQGFGQIVSHPKKIEKKIKNGI